MAASDRPEPSTPSGDRSLPAWVPDSDDVVPWWPASLSWPSWPGLSSSATASPTGTRVASPTGSSTTRRRGRSPTGASSTARSSSTSTAGCSPSGAPTTSRCACPSPSSAACCPLGAPLSRAPAPRRDGRDGTISLVQPRPAVLLAIHAQRRASSRRSCSWPSAASSASTTRAGRATSTPRPRSSPSGSPRRRTPRCTS